MTTILVAIAFISLALCGVAVWLGIYRSWADHLPSSLCYPVLGVPWIILGIVALAIFSLASQVLTGLLLAVTRALEDPVYLTITIIILTVSFLGWPRWAMPPWFRQLEEGRRARSRQRVTFAPSEGSLGEHQALPTSWWRRWRYVVAALTLLSFVVLLSVQIPEWPPDLFSLAGTVFLSALLGLGSMLNFKRNEERFRSHGWRW